MEGDTPPKQLETTETSSPTKPASKSRYSSCLSSFRNNYKPPANFKPSNISSPKVIVEKKLSESDACHSIDIPSLLGVPIAPRTPESLSLNKASFSSALSPQDISFIDISAPSPFKDDIGQGSPNLGNYVSLTGKGGDWRGPNQSDMTPENKSRQQFHQGGGFRNSRGGRDSYMGGMNSSTPNQSFGRNNRNGNSSFNNSQGGFSPYNSPGTNSSNRGNKRGPHHNTPSVDISSYYSPAMTQDPWADLVKRKKHFQENRNSSQNTSTSLQ